MATVTHIPNLPQVDEHEVGDPELIRVVEAAAVTKSPPPAWYRTMGNNPEVAVAFANYWDLLHRGGLVPHEIKELARIQIAQMVECEFCASQVSPLAEIDQETKMACALPNFEHPDPKTRAALHYARSLTLMDGREEQVYEDLHEHFTDAEIIEMAAFFALTAGGNRMARHWAIQADVGGIVPEGALSIHG